MGNFGSIYKNLGIFLMIFAISVACLACGLDDKTCLDCCSCYCENPPSGDPPIKHTFTLIKKKQSCFDEASCEEVCAESLQSCATKEVTMCDINAVDGDSLSD